jgi:hypothetical protein
MRYVQVPSPILFVPTETQRKSGAEEKRHTFLATLQDVWLCDAEHFGKGKGVRAALRLERLFEVAAAGDWVAVEEEDWRLLCDAVENCPNYNPGVMRHLVPFLDAVVEALKEDDYKRRTAAAAE